MKQIILAGILFLPAVFFPAAARPLVTYVNPFLGTAPLTNPADIGFTPPWRPGSSVVSPMAPPSRRLEDGRSSGLVTTP